MHPLDNSRKAGWFGRKRNDGAPTIGPNRAVHTTRKPVTRTVKPLQPRRVSPTPPPVTAPISRPASHHPSPPEANIASTINIEWDGLLTSFKSFVGKIFDFKGRARRQELWSIFVSMIVAGMLLEFFMGFGSIGKELWTWISILSAVSTLSLVVRRLHDGGYSAWLLAILGIPGGIFVLLILLLQDSKRDHNAYGPSPKYGPDLAQADHF